MLRATRLLIVKTMQPDKTLRQTTGVTNALSDSRATFYIGERRVVLTIRIDS